jgi:exodeoxyribonuclease VII small subunit
MTDQATQASQASDQAAASDVDRRLEALPFDRALAELQSVVTRLEAGNLPLEESIALYEQGVRLHERCARLLGQAELRVQRLVESAGGQLRALDLSLGENEES